MAGDIVVWEKAMSKSRAFRTLTATAIIVLHDFMGKRQIKTRKSSNGSKEMRIINNGAIEYCFSEAEAKGITRPAFNRARDLLIANGFIDIAHAGSGGKKGDKTLYSISDRWRHWGTEKFSHQERKKDSRRGVGFAKYWEERKTGNAGDTSISNTGVTRKFNYPRLE